MVREIASVMLVFVIMLATEYLWMATCECITVGGLLSTHGQMFHSNLWIYCSPEYQYAFRYSIYYASLHIILPSF